MGSPARLRPDVIQITKLSFHKGKRVSTTRRKELTDHRKRDAIAEKMLLLFLIGIKKRACGVKSEY